MHNILSRLTGICLAVLVSVASLPAFGQDRGTVTIKMTDVPMSQVMREIEQKTDFVFLNKDVDVTRRVSINVADRPVSDVLELLFKGQGVDYRIDAMHIVISSAARKNPQGGAADSDVIKGTVIDSYGFPVIGVGVIIKGTTTGTSTDLDGNFSFELPAGMEGSVLEFSCLGYGTQEFQIGSRRVFDVTMQDDAILMEGTVVTALGIKRSEKALSYNVQQVNADAITANKDANFINSLNGKVAGLNINASSSGVGGATKVVMRGTKSISQSSNALYVIDGVPMYTSARDGGTEFASQDRRTRLRTSTRTT